MNRTADEEQTAAYVGQELLLFILGLLAFSNVALVAAYQRAGQPPTAAELRVCQSAPSSGVVAEPRDAPPLLVFSEADGFSFPVGSAEIDPTFLVGLLASIPTLLAAAKRHELDLLEVVGHTDEVRLSGGRSSNLDHALQLAPEQRLSAADNAGLAMMRALAAAHVLRQHPSLRRAGIRVVALSAGQFVDLEGKPTAGGGMADARRRRIELRLRKLGK